MSLRVVCRDVAARGWLWALGSAALLALAVPSGARAQPPPATASSGGAEDSTRVRQPAAPAAASTAVANHDQELARIRAAHLSTSAAILMSAPVPGWGQLYADNTFWSVVAYGVQWYFLGNIVLQQRRVERQRVALELAPAGSDEAAVRELLLADQEERVRDFVWWAAGGLLVIALDAYVSVSLADFDDPTVRTPDLDREWPKNDEHGEQLKLGLHLRF